MGMLCDLAGERAQNVVLHMKGVQQLHGVKNSGKGSPPGGIDSGVVVAMGQQIQRNAHKIIVLCQIPAPVLVQGDRVGLQGIIHPDPRIPLTGDAGKFLKPAKSCQCGLAALEGKVDMISGGELTCKLTEHFMHLFRGHDAVGADIPEVSNVRIEAVPAPQVAKRGCRLDNNG